MRNNAHDHDYRSTLSTPSSSHFALHEPCSSYFYLFFSPLYLSPPVAPTTTPAVHQLEPACSISHLVSLPLPVAGYSSETGGGPAALWIPSSRSCGVTYALAGERCVCIARSDDIRMVHYFTIRTGSEDGLQHYKGKHDDTPAGSPHRSDGEEETGAPRGGASSSSLAAQRPRHHSGIRLDLEDPATADITRAAQQDSLTMASSLQYGATEVFIPCARLSHIQAMAYYWRFMDYVDRLRDAYLERAQQWLEAEAGETAAAAALQEEEEEECGAADAFHSVSGYSEVPLAGNKKGAKERNTPCGAGAGAGNAAEGALDEDGSASLLQGATPPGETAFTTASLDSDVSSLFSSFPGAAEEVMETVHRIQEGRRRIAEVGGRIDPVRFPLDAAFAGVDPALDDADAVALAGVAEAQAAQRWGPRGAGSVQAESSEVLLGYNVWFQARDPAAVLFIEHVLLYSYLHLDLEERKWRKRRDGMKGTVPGTSRPAAVVHAALRPPLPWPAHRVRAAIQFDRRGAMGKKGELPAEILTRDQFVWLTELVECAAYMQCYPLRGAVAQYLTCWMMQSREETMASVLTLTHHELRRTLWWPDAIGVLEGTGPHKDGYDAEMKDRQCVYADADTQDGGSDTEEERKVDPRQDGEGDAQSRREGGGGGGGRLNYGETPCVNKSEKDESGLVFPAGTAPTLASASASPPVEERSRSTKPHTDTEQSTAAAANTPAAMEEVHLAGLDLDLEDDWETAYLKDEAQEALRQQQKGDGPSEKESGSAAAAGGQRQPPRPSPITPDDVVATSCATPAPVAQGTAAGDDDDDDDDEVGGEECLEDWAELLVEDKMLAMTWEVAFSPRSQAEWERWEEDYVKDRHRLSIQHQIAEEYLQEHPHSTGPLRDGRSPGADHVEDGAAGEEELPEPAAVAFVRYTQSVLAPLTLAARREILEGFYAAQQQRLQMGSTILPSY
eukprot:gene11911-8193_t